MTEVANLVLIELGTHLPDDFELKSGESSGESQEDGQEGMDVIDQIDEHNMLNDSFGASATPVKNMTGGVNGPFKVNAMQSIPSVLPHSKTPDKNKRYVNNYSNMDMSEMNVTGGNLSLVNKSINPNTLKSKHLETTLNLNTTDSELNFALGNK